jgi:hypothetical protein
MIIIFENHPILSFFRKNEAIFTVLSLFTVFFGILLAEKNPSSSLIQALLFIYLLLIILYGIVIIDGIGTGFINHHTITSLTELLEYGLIGVISIIMSVIILIMGDFLFSNHFSEFAFAFYYFLWAVALFVLPNVLNYYQDKINNVYIAIIGLFILIFFTIGSIFIIIQQISWAASNSM